MPLFAKDQPKDGDCIFHCGHTKAETHHFYMFVQPTMALLPKGRTVEAKWIIFYNICDKL